MDLKGEGQGETRLYDGQTYLQNKKVDFRFYQLLKYLFKYYYVKADILNPLCNTYIRNGHDVTNSAQHLHLRSRLYRLILISILTVRGARTALILTFHIWTLDQMGF